jgi:hypothetical protein
LFVTVAVMRVRMTGRRVAALLLAVAAMSLATGSTAAPVDASSVVHGTPLQLLARLSTRAEHTWGYSRSYFPTWIDADHDGCNTRYEVLIAESRTTVHVGSGCYLTHGSWLSVYDGYVSNNPTRFDIDHVVALKEAWDSGAWAWTTSRRRAYANDLGDGRTLRAVSVASNEAKSDKDPAQWLPMASFRCTYVTWWVDIKVRWRLSVDSAERAAIRAVLTRCSAPIQAVAIA